ILAWSRSLPNTHTHTRKPSHIQYSHRRRSRGGRDFLDFLDFIFKNKNTTTQAVLIINVKQCVVLSVEKSLSPYSSKWFGSHAVSNGRGYQQLRVSVNQPSTRSDCKETNHTSKTSTSKSQT